MAVLSRDRSSAILKCFCHSGLVILKQTETTESVLSAGGKRATRVKRDKTLVTGEWKNLRLMARSVSPAGTIPVDEHTLRRSVPLGFHTTSVSLVYRLRKFLFRWRRGRRESGRSIFRVLFVSA